MNLETKGKINLTATFIQRFVAQSKLSLVFPKTLYFHAKQLIFRITHMTLKNADNWKFPITKLNHWLTFRKQPIIAGDEIKVNVILATKYKVKAKNFIIPTFYFPVSFLLYKVCDNTSTFSFFIIIAFLFEDCSKASKEQVTINKLYIKFDVLVLQRYSAASNSKETSGGTL